MFLFLILSAYLLGSLSGALLTCKLLQLPDPRTGGSGNPGATNVLRQNGRLAAFLTLVIDVLKAVIALWLAKFFTEVPLFLATVALAVWLGHLYPIFFQFRGGKGVATAFGIFLVLVWPVSLAALVTWLVMAFLFRYSSVAALTAALLTPVYMYGFTSQPPYLVLSLIISSLLIWRHRTNIRDLLSGRESKIGHHP